MADQPEPQLQKSPQTDHDQNNNDNNVQTPLASSLFAQLQTLQQQSQRHIGMRDTNSTFYDPSTMTPGTQLTPHTLDASDSDLIIQQQQDIHHHHNQQTSKRRRTRDEDARDDIDAAMPHQGGRQAKRRFCSIGQEQKAEDQQEQGPWQPVAPATRPLSSLDARVHSHDVHDVHDVHDGTNEPTYPTFPTSKGGQWTEQYLRRVVKKASESQFLCASAIHPTASVVANSIDIPPTSINIYHTLQSLLPSIPSTAACKLEFVRRPTSDQSTRVRVERRRKERGRLVITMPSRVHEAFIPFSHDVADQLFESHFLPPHYKRKEILQSGSTELQNNFKGLVPDAGISFFTSRNTFLVLEVADSQKGEDAQRKAQDYILDSGGKITFVVLVIVTKKPRKTTTDAQQQSGTLLNEDNLSPDHDTVHVHVYKSLRRPPNTLTGQHLIDRLQIFPGPDPIDTFTISWVDIKCGSWSDFPDGARLPPDASEPTCDINFSALFSIARHLAGQGDDSREGTPLYRPELSSRVGTPILNKKKFVNSSSPAVQLSSRGTVRSDEGRRHDPEYQPSLGSD